MLEHLGELEDQLDLDDQAEPEVNLRQALAGL